MIKFLLIKNFILIDELFLEFEKGLNVFTGETGAGKSIILKALDIALGARATRDVIKEESKNAAIEAVFEKPDGMELVISKEISTTGSKCRIDGVLVSNDAVKELRESLLDIHSQHQTYTYMSPKYHIELLDMYISKENPCYREKLDECAKLYDEIKSTKETLEKIKQNNDANERQIDFLKFQVDEIEKAQVEAGEEERLRGEMEVLSNVQTIKELCHGAFWTLGGDDDSVCAALSNVGYSISRASSLDNSLAKIEESFIEAKEGLKACSDELRRYCDRLSDDPQRLDEVNERLSLIEKLKRKYGDIFETYERLSRELEELEGSAMSAPRLVERLSELENRADELTSEISSLRNTKGEELSRLIVGELEKLELAKTRFRVDIRQVELNKNGKDDVEFLISTNVSQELTPLVKTASGGEISRVMLAIKTVFAKTDKPATIVFDEIDTGISGKTSQAVASSLQELSCDCQVFVITHQPIIASKANVHFEVSKDQGDTATSVSVLKLNDDERLKALARLASGGVNDNSVSFAKDLLNAAH